MRVLTGLLLGLSVLTGSARPAHATAGGTSSLQYGADGCNACHRGGAVPVVTLEGPTTVAPGSSHDYAVTIGAPGTQDHAGLNVSADTGVLGLVDADSELTSLVTGSSDRLEVTQREAKLARDGATVFRFSWTAPTDFAQTTLTVWGNAVDGNFSPLGDAAARTTLVVANAATPGLATSTPSLPRPTPTPRKLANPIRARIRAGGIKVRLETVASGFASPVWAGSAPGLAERVLFVVDQPGRLWRVDLVSGEKRVVLDVHDRLVPLGVFGEGTYDERGFLGLAFAPDFGTSGLLYTFTSEPVRAGADFSTMPEAVAPDHQNVVTEWRMPNPLDPGATVDPMSARELLRVDHPQFNHNGGCLQFGPDRMLYVSFGDGGGADDQDGQPFIGGPTTGHGPNGNAQNTSALLGKILRLDPRGSNGRNRRFGIPADNPFVADPTAAPEIWAWGLRNPFSFSFDPVGGALYAVDVGQNDVEEVDVIRRGGNYGWHGREGRFAFVPNGPGAGFVTHARDRSETIDPIAEYDHDEGISIIGGHVYRGILLPRLVGRYVFAEFARSFHDDGRLFYLTAKEAVTSQGHTRRSRIAELRLVGNEALHVSVLGIGRDATGELYLLANQGAVPFGQTGVVQRITAAPAR